MEAKSPLFLMPMMNDLQAAHNTLSHSVLFSCFEADEVQELAGYFNPTFLPRGEALFHALDRTNGIYLVQAGLLTEESESTGHAARSFGPGSLVGEEALFLTGVRERSIVAEEDTRLLFMPNSLVQRYLLEDQRFTVLLNTLTNSRTLAQNIKSTWLKPDERLNLITRKHPLVLSFHLALPTLAFLVVLILVGQLNRLPLFWQRILLLFGFLLAVLTFVWRINQWATQYYAVTNQRILKLERSGRAYVSRDEVPLTALAGYAVKTKVVDSFLGYADLLLQTYLGDIVFEKLEDPASFGKLVQAYAQRERAANPQSSARQLHAALNRKIGKPVEGLSEAEMEVEAARIATETREQKGVGILAWLFADFLRLRQEADGTTSYRKHWIVLFTRNLLPSLILAGLAWLAYGFFTGEIKIVEASTALTVLALAMLAVFVWMVLNYNDWRNDLYQLTDVQVIDVDRNIFGSESNRSAPLENILSVQYQRKGLLGLIFNYGTVFISVGVQDLSFEDVHRPAQVQQEIFARMNERQAALRRELGEQEQERMREWFRIYQAGMTARSQEGTRPLKVNPP